MKIGTIDFLCRDVNAKPVGLELKYPKATKSDAKQIVAYAEEMKEVPGGEGFRGIMVAPIIADDLKKLLDEKGLEWKEVAWEDDEELVVESQDVDEEEDDEMAFFKQ